MKINTLNLAFGIILLLGFLISGQYLKHYFKPNHLDQYLMRLQIRSSHIYILFIACLNIIAFKTKTDLKIKIQKTLNLTWRVCLIIAGLLFILAFLKEHTGEIKNRTLTLIGANLTLTSIGLFLLNETISHFKKYMTHK